MEEMIVSILMRKIVINDNFYLFKPIHVLEGKIICSTDTGVSYFIDRYENTYDVIDNSHNDISGATEYFGYPKALEQLKKTYETDDADEAIKDYFDDMNRSMYIGNVDYTKDILNIVPLAFDKLTNIFNKTFKNELDMNLESIQENINSVENKTIKKMLTLTNTTNIDELLELINDLMKVLDRETDESNTLKEELLKLPEAIETNDLEENKEQNNLPFDVADMYKYVTSKVINQNEAVKKIIMTFAINYLASNSNNIQDLQPTRCLITGPTGVGKTLILETILEYLEKNSEIHIPMVKVPTSQLTSAGYVGMNLEDILEELVSKVTHLKTLEEQIKYAEKNGVVFLDEIDKKGSSNNNDVSGRGVLNALLQFLDGSNYQIFKQLKYPPIYNSNTIYFNTKYLNIFASGAFTHVNDEIKKKSVGFKETSTKDEIIKPRVADYIKKGQMPSEFMGRFHQIVNLNSLNEKDLQKILTDSISSPIIIEQQKLLLAGINLSWDESFVEEIAKKAHSLKLGARSLKTIIEEVLFDLKWNALLTKDEASYIVTKETVENSKQYKRI